MMNGIIFCINGIILQLRLKRKSRILLRRIKEVYMYQV